MSSIALKAELADKYLGLDQQEHAKQEIKQVAQLSHEILSEVRQAVSGLKKYNLSDSLNKLIAELHQQQFIVQCDNSLPAINAQVESTLTLILTEAITNILRHSNGDAVNIVLSSAKQQISLAIHDNGKCGNFVQGNGLQGISERCQQLNGNVSIDTESGFALNIILPENENR